MCPFKLGQKIWLIDMEHFKSIDLTVEAIMHSYHTAGCFGLSGKKNLIGYVVDVANLALGLLESSSIRFRDECHIELGSFRVVRSNGRIINNYYLIDLELQVLNDYNWLEDGF